jgi:hypothetical protein
MHMGYMKNPKWLYGPEGIWHCLKYASCVVAGSVIKKPS